MGSQSGLSRRNPAILIWRNHGIGWKPLSLEGMIQISRRF
jgi:hypothetical protein